MSVQCVIVKKETLSTSAAGGSSTTVEGDRVHILYAPFEKKELMKVVVEMKWAKESFFYLTKKLVIHLLQQHHVHIGKEQKIKSF